MNCEATHRGQRANQIIALDQAGYLDQPVNETTSLRTLARADDTDFPLEHRFRSYLAVNCSGLLDANVNGGRARSNGTDIAEICISNAVVSEMSSTNIDQFLALRNSRHRFETLPELAQLGLMSGSLDDYPSTLFIYSRFPANQFRVGTPPYVADSVYIGGDETSVIATQQAPWNAISKQFEAMGLDSATAQTAARNVVDYIDADYEPGNGAGLLDFCTEPVPMINEIVIKSTLSADMGTSEYVNRLDISVELWYPFVGPPHDLPYSVELVMWSVGGTPAFGWTPAGAPSPKLAYIGANDWSVDRYKYVTIPDEKRSPFTDPKPSLPQVLLCEVRVRSGNLDANGVMVDKVQQFGTPWNQFQYLTAPDPADPVPDPGENPTDATIGKEADDPRLNWQWSNPVHWLSKVGGGDSLDGENVGRVTYADPTADGTWYMYVRNAANLPTVGDLGFVLYTNTPWHTIRLLDPGALRVLDRFTVDSRRLRKGLININSKDEDALAAAFINVPIERYPGELPAPLVTVAEARTLAQSFIATTILAFTNLSDLKLVPAFATLWPDQMQQEGVVRSSAGLLSVRQNVFTVILAAQSVMDANGVSGIQSEDVRAEQRALVVVWRDPYPDSAGRHPTFVRYFKWLTE